MADPKTLFKSYDRLELIRLKDQRDEAAASMVHQSGLTLINAFLGDTHVQMAILVGAFTFITMGSGVSAAILPCVALRLGLYVVDPWLERRNKVAHYEAQLEQAAEEAMRAAKRYSNLDLERVPSWIKSEIDGINRSITVAEAGIDTHRSTSLWEYSSLTLAWRQIKKDWTTWRELRAQIRSAEQKSTG